MQHSIGQVIKKLRKERNLTQEELAELLNVTPQAISKWENETGMPDISQVVPLASTFGVSTDVLFGIGITDDEEVQKLIEANTLNVKDYKEKEDRKFALKQFYDGLQAGLLRYPNNMRLLMLSLEYSMSLAYPENDTYYAEYANDIYNEAIRQANIVISYGKNTTDVLRAHMIMVLLHSQYGNINLAWKHANEFPWRSDMTIHEMSAYIAHAQKDYKNEALHCERDIMYHFEAILDNITQLGCAYLQLKKHDEALKILESVFALIKLFFGEEEYLPPLHCRELGDVHMLISQIYLEMGDDENAIYWLEKMVNYDLNVRKFFTNDMMVKTPLLRDVGFTFYWAHYDAKEKLKEKLSSSTFDSLRNSEKFILLKSKVE